MPTYYEELYKGATSIEINEAYQINWLLFNETNKEGKPINKTKEETLEDKFLSQFK